MRENIAAAAALGAVALVFFLWCGRELTTMREELTEMRRDLAAREAKIDKLDATLRRMERRMDRDEGVPEEPAEAVP
jgi:hypothetical protein